MESHRPSSVARNYLKTQFPEDRIIAREVGQLSTPRSLDLTPLDYWRCRVNKARVYHCNRPATLEELQESIESAIDNIKANELKRLVGKL